MLNIVILEAFHIPKKKSKRSMHAITTSYQHYSEDLSQVYKLINYKKETKMFTTYTQEDCIHKKKYK